MAEAQKLDCRDLSAFERLFIGANVRLLAHVTLLAPVAPETLRTALRSAARNWLPAHLQLGEDQHSLVLYDQPAVELADLVVPRVETASQSGSAVTSDRLQQEAHTDRPVQPVKVQVLLTTDSKLAVGFLLNANHAFMDGRLLKAYLEAVAALCTDGTPVTKPLPSALGPPSFRPYWSSLLPDPLQCSPLKAPVLKAQALFGTTPDSRGVNLHRCLDPQASQALRAYLKAHVNGPFTLNVGLVAGLLLGVAAEYASHHPDAPACPLAVSTLVDVRPDLPADVDAGSQLALSSITTELSVASPKADENAASSTQRHVFDTVCAQYHARLQEQLAAGEAYVQTLALQEGRFAEGAPSASFEVSNLGATNLAGTALLGQRFDAFTGLSILVHTDPAGLHLAAAVGAGVDAHAVARALGNTLALWTSLGSPGSVPES
ncbi:uncharacterized protein MONBRDRAFT_11327 [Monosiga brevicollis MX1]|uniref:Uncharacterized protein n=1 Tax=Monosiga brevicollis TaxID=81824 RepID=A9V8W9_MONBE|nr:uncharacterized protein MONBRDRAFT_11327 [Monosiga brevicollis MX1]EDQ86032.1 predicted protein [Monosiga brevicollis MX1]|eukprot:XP_001749226.1 hypothetical protein [Monosiga brevicollis MX1]